MHQIILIITGSIAANKGVELFYNLKKTYEVKLIVTQGAEKFINNLPKEAICDQSFKENNLSSFHVEINKNNHLLIIYPASQNFIAKVTHGFSDTLSTLVWSANNSHKLVFPAMNTNMYNNQATIDNIAKLRSFGVEILKPKIGQLACKTIGIGRAWEPQSVKKYINNYFKMKDKLSQTNILLSYGKTKTYIDPIRYITNKSSGKMGQAIYQSLKQTNAKIITIVGEVEEKNQQDIEVQTNSQMMKAIKKYFNQQDIVINLAALNDYKVKNWAKTKISKHKNQEYNLKLTKNIDILEELGKIKKHQLLIGFSAQEDFNDQETPLRKITLKNLDAIIVNQINVMGKDKTKIRFITKNYEKSFSGLKQVVAKKIVEQIILLKELKVIERG